MIFTPPHKGQVPDSTISTRKIISTGRGGTGKSTFVALALRYLRTPSLLVDLDPDSSLPSMIGVDLEREGKRTVCEVLYDVIMRRKQNVAPTVTTHDQMQSMLWSDALYEGKGFDLLTLGTKYIEGCYCAPDNLLRTTIQELVRNYAHLVVDSPAGVEHLNRNVVSDVDDLFVLCDPSQKALKHIKRVKRILEQVGISYRNFYLVANHQFDSTSESHLKEAGGTYLGRIEYDPEVDRCNLEGRSLLKLPDDSPARLSVKNLLARAGYPQK
ncbi:MAG: AAA family ATPase [Chloroflexota bacterium]